MNRTTVSVTTVSRHLSDYINRAAYCDEYFVLTRGNRPVAELSPLPAARRLGELPEIFDSLPSLTDEEAGAFESDLAAFRKEAEAAELIDPWDT